MRYAERNGLVIDQKHIYHDAATSGTLRDRHGLNGMLQAAREGHFDIVLVDDLSRLSRDAHHMLSHIKELAFLGICIHSVADNLDTSKDSAKFAYFFKGMMNEAYIDDLKEKTLRGQLGQRGRGYFVGEKTFGYESEPHGDIHIDKKGRARPDGYKMKILPDESATVKKIFQMYDDGMAAIKIVNYLNTNKIRGNKNQSAWSVSSVHRILRNQKYIGIWAWGKTQIKRNPLTGAIKQVPRKEPLHVAIHDELRIIPQELWDRVQTRLKEVEKNWTAKTGRKGFSKNQGSYVKAYPHELLSGAMVCSVCGCTIGKVSGKSGGYYGCMKAEGGL